MSRGIEVNPLVEGQLKTRPKPEIKEPKLYKVIIHNDHYTTMDFVVYVISTVFHKSAAEATRIMLEVHNKGSSIAGIYPYDIAVTKINKVHAMARLEQFPLRCSCEEA